MISRAIWCSKLYEIFQRLQIALALQTHAMLLSLKNLLLLINTKLRTKLSYYLYLTNYNFVTTLPSKEKLGNLC